MEQQGYVDDFITVGAPGASECMRNIQAMQVTCKAANMPVEPEKNEGPATVISFLGLELDSVRREIRNFYVCDR